MNSKEALEKLLELITYYDYWLQAHDYKKIIEKDLKRLEQLEKYKKAIEILKDNICAYQYNENEFGLVIASYDGAVPITQQEYELLKEVLENETNN